MHDVIVVGGGPSGSLVSRLLAERNYEVQMLEDHAASGEPQHCSGIVSDETIRMSKVEPEIINTIHGLDFTFPNGQSIEVRSDVHKARIIDRMDFDRKMADAAADAGTDILYSDRYSGHRVGDIIHMDSTSGLHRAKALIGADGSSSKVAMSLSENNYPKEYVRGIQADVTYRMDDQEVIKVFFGNKVAPGFFAWMIPCGSFTRVGLCAAWSAGSPAEYLKDMLIRQGLQDKVEKVYAGKIPLGTRPMICDDRCLLIGDAAGFVKPLSGGGLYPGLKSAINASKILSSRLDSDSLFSRDLVEYEKVCRADFGRELDEGYSARKRFKKLSDSDFNKVYDFVTKNDLVPQVRGFEWDHPLSSIHNVMKSPKLILSALPLLMRSL